jgi:hypothetical protein
MIVGCGCGGVAAHFNFANNRKIPKCCPRHASGVSRAARLSRVMIHTQYFD